MSCFSDGVKDVREFFSGISLSSEAMQKAEGLTSVATKTVESVEAAKQSVTHVVRSGETLSTIAGKYENITYQDIAKANGISNPDNIYVGQRLNIPNQSSVPKPKVSTTPAKTKPTIKQPSDETSMDGGKGSGCEKCGKEYSKKVQCTRYGKIYGPVYWGTKRLKNYLKWDELIQNGVLSQTEKDIIVGMSANEGKLDSVQSYDSEILTVGAMQKTINLEGEGEFPIQVEKFKTRFPHKYKMLLENCGWTVSHHIMYYQDPDDKNAKKITATELKRKIRKGFSKENFTKYIRSKPIEPVIRLAKDADFQSIQIEDFIQRLRKKVLPLRPKTYQYALKDYVKSKLGRATLLDHHINRPGYVSIDFKKALDNFFIHNPHVSKNPNVWGHLHSSYESKIIDYYGKHRRGTDMVLRFNKLVKAFK